MFKNEAKPAPKRLLTVPPKLCIDMNKAKRVPSIPGGHSFPEIIRNGIRLHQQREEKSMVASKKKTDQWWALELGDIPELSDCTGQGRTTEHHVSI